jgi:hypothetical protein
MKLFNLFALAMLVTLSSGTLGFAQPPKLHRTLPHNYLSEPQKVKPHKDVVEAVIVDIDYQLGVLAADTEIGLIYFHLAPEEARTFQIGDTIQVHVLSADTLVI